MEIQTVDCFPVAIPIDTLGYDEDERTERLLVRIRTDDGVEGWGEVHSEPSLAVARTIVEDVFAPELVGRDVDEIRSFVDEFFYYYVDISTYLGGVETAMWDALGRTLDAPLHQLLGGSVDDCVAFSYFSGDLDPEPSREIARQALDSGFSVAKVKGGTDWRRDVERIRAMHDEVDGELDFRLDPNQAWTFEDAVRVGAELERDGIFLQYLEQPIRIDTMGTYETLRNRLRQPICVNEDAYFRHNLYELLKTDAIDAAVVDLAVSGGILALQELGALASQSGISMAHHCGGDLGIQTAAILHAVGSTPSINLANDTVYELIEDDVIEDHFTFSDGTLAVPDGPGLGVNVDLDAVHEYEVSRGRAQ